MEGLDHIGRAGKEESNYRKTSWQHGRYLQRGWYYEKITMGVNTVTVCSSQSTEQIMSDKKMI